MIGACRQPQALPESADRRDHGEGSTVDEIMPPIIGMRCLEKKNRQFNMLSQAVRSSTGPMAPGAPLMRGLRSTAPFLLVALSAGYFLYRAIDLTIVGNATLDRVKTHEETSMHHLNIPEMTCGHCVSAVEKAVKSVDPNAEVAVNLEAKTASIDSQAASEAFVAAIEDAGYKASFAKSCCSHVA